MNKGYFDPSATRYNIPHSEITDLRYLISIFTIKIFSFILKIVMENFYVFCEFLEDAKQREIMPEFYTMIILKYLP